MTRKKKLLYNTGAAILHQIVTLVCGLILPKLIISHYGSVTNGLVTSISQYLAFFAMMEMGVGAVVRASLYKPLAEHDETAVSRVLISSRRFFRKIGLLLCVYTVLLMVYFPLAVDHSNGYLSTVILVGATAFGSLSTYLFGIVYQQLLNSDQKSYVQLCISILTTVLNTVMGVVLIRLDAGIETVKLAGALIVLIRPLLLKWYVDRHYRLNFRLQLTEEPIRQKWNGLAQHIATYVLKHADTVILTIFSKLEYVSVYYVYHLVTNGLQQLIEVLTTGMSALLGNMFAKKETGILDRTFSAFEIAIHTLVTVAYSVAAVMIIPFVRVYTKGVTDAEYIVPLFAALIVAANASYSLRMPYLIMVLSAGHFKETQTSAIIEAALNVVISIVLVGRYGLPGVAVGTLVAMLFRTVYLAWYLKGHILNRPFGQFLRQMAVDILSVAAVLLSTSWLDQSSVTWAGWVRNALITGVIAAAECLGIRWLFYRSLMKDSLALLVRKKRIADPKDAAEGKEQADEQDTH